MMSLMSTLDMKGFQRDFALKLPVASRCLYVVLHTLSAGGCEHRHRGRVHVADDVKVETELKANDCEGE